MTKSTLHFLCLALLTTSASTAYSQAHTESRNAIAYDAAFFAQFNTLTALDMVQQVPGFNIDDGDDRRGLAGSLSNVLIEGQRVSTKGTGVFGALRRIPASDVVSVQLIRGNTADIDMRGQSSVVNLVLKEGAGRSGSARLRFTNWESGRVIPTGEASVTFSNPRYTLTLGSDLNGQSIGTTERREIRDQKGEMTRTLRGRDSNFFYEVSPFFNALYNFDNGDRLSFGAQGWNWHSDWYGISRGYDADDLYQNIQEQDRDYGGFVFNLNAEYERALTEDVSLHLIGFMRDGDWDHRRDFTTVLASGALDHRTLIDDVIEAGEQILRSQLSWTPEGPHALELAIERTFTYRDSDYHLQEDTGSGLTSVALPVSNTRVEEIRWDYSLTHTWQAQPTLSVETTLAYETPSLTQTGDAEQSRDLSYFKPSLALTWDLNDQNQIRGQILRDIGQLDFRDFISSVNVTDGQTNVGNPDLEPTQSWLAEIAWERRFAENASLTLTANHRVYDAVSGTVPLNQGQSEGPGNLEDGRRSEIRLEANLPLERYGLSGAVLQPTVSLRHSEVTDPFTGEKGRIPGVADWTLDLGYRQDLRSAGWAWGFDYSYGSPEDVYRLKERRYIEQSTGDLDLFVETSRYFGITARLGATSVIQDASIRRRVFYSPQRKGGERTGEELRHRDRYRSVYLELSKTF